MIRIKHFGDITKIDGHCNAEFCCDNADSEYYAVPTLFDDTCDEWEEEE